MATPKGEPCACLFRFPFEACKTRFGFPPRPLQTSYKCKKRLFCLAVRAVVSTASAGWFRRSLASFPLPKCTTDSGGPLGGNYGLLVNCWVAMGSGPFYFNFLMKMRPRLTATPFGSRFKPKNPEIRPRSQAGIRDPERGALRAVEPSRGCPPPGQNQQADF